jgi:enoyl-CoA hydratase
MFLKRMNPLLPMETGQGGFTEFRVGFRSEKVTRLRMAEIELTYPREGIALVTMNRPDKLNAMTSAMVESLHETFSKIGKSRDVRVVVLTGSGRGFCAGLDLGGYGEAPGFEWKGSVEKGFAVQKHIASLIPKMRSIPQPIIAAVNGPAAGGGFALVLGSDLRICSETARFNAAFIRIGLSADRCSPCPRNHVDGSLV